MIIKQVRSGRRGTVSLQHVVDVIVEPAPSADLYGPPPRRWRGSQEFVKTFVAAFSISAATGRVAGRTTSDPFGSVEVVPEPRCCVS